jgi:hypothetical protein
MQQSDPNDGKWLFIHIMKTAGTSFRHFCLESHQNLVYPTDADLKANPVPGWYLTSEEFIAFVNGGGLEQGDAKFIFGHYPYSIIRHLKPRFRVATVLREPVARSISQIKHRRRSAPDRFKAMSDIEVLKTTGSLERQVRNYQTKVLGMLEHPSIGVNDPVIVDETMFQRALENLEAVEFLGLTERLDETVSLWNRIEPSFAQDVFPRKNESRITVDANDELVGFLKENLDFDIRLYEAACRIFENRLQRSQQPVV